MTLTEDATQVPRPTGVIETSGGAIRGLQSGRVSRYLGIRYGMVAPRTGRFRPASRVAPHSGVQDCFAYGASALPAPMAMGAGAMPPEAFLLAAGTFLAAGDTVAPSEDCLFLNVFSPASGRGGRRPVMVWLHGGGFSAGSGSVRLYDGGALCRRGEVVVVTLNHRLGAFGHLYLGEYGSEYQDSGNLGMLDIVLALRWVRDNIEAFGGDPANVTLFGESAGGAKVSALLAMPAAAGLFHKAIIQSGVGSRVADRDRAAAIAEQTLASLGVSGSDRRKLEELQPQIIISAAAAAEGPSGLLPRGLAPVVDGSVLPRHPFDPDAPDLERRIPLLIGTNRDEFTVFLGGDPLFGRLTAAQAVERLDAFTGGRGNSLHDAYRDALRGEEGTYILSSILSDLVFWDDALKIAEGKAGQRGGSPVFMYRLDWKSPAWDGRLRACHGLDLPLMFDNVDLALNLVGEGSSARKVAAQMSQAWVNFARTGDPAQAGLPWPAFSLQRRETMIFDESSRVANDPDSARRKIAR